MLTDLIEDSHALLVRAGFVRQVGTLVMLVYLEWSVLTRAGACWPVPFSSFRSTGPGEGREAS